MNVLVAENDKLTRDQAVVGLENFGSFEVDVAMGMTALADDVTDPNDLPIDARGLWGGLILLGKASLNSTPGETPIEGIPTTELRGLYGGSDDVTTPASSGTYRSATAAPTSAPATRSTA